MQVRIAINGGLHSSTVNGVKGKVLFTPWNSRNVIVWPIGADALANLFPLCFGCPGISQAREYIPVAERGHESNKYTT